MSFVVVEALLEVVPLLVVERGDLIFCFRAVFCFGEEGDCVVIAAGWFIVLLLALMGCGVDGREFVADIVSALAFVGVRSCEVP